MEHFLWYELKGLVSAVYLYISNRYFVRIDPNSVSWHCTLTDKVWTCWKLDASAIIFAFAITQILYRYRRIRKREMILGVTQYSNWQQPLVTSRYIGESIHTGKNRNRKPKTQFLSLIPGGPRHHHLFSCCLPRNFPTKFFRNCPNIFPNFSAPGCFAQINFYCHRPKIPPKRMI